MPQTVGEVVKYFEMVDVFMGFGDMKNRVTSLFKLTEMSFLGNFVNADGCMVSS